MLSKSRLTLSKTLHTFQKKVGLANQFVIQLMKIIRAQKKRDAKCSAYYGSRWTIKFMHLISNNAKRSFQKRSWIMKSVTATISFLSPCINWINWRKLHFLEIDVDRIIISGTCICMHDMNRWLELAPAIFFDEHIQLSY